MVSSLWEGEKQEGSDSRSLFIIYETIKRESGVLCVVYYESRNREVKIRLMNEGRCDKRLKARIEESTCLTYTGFHGKTN